LDFKDHFSSYTVVPLETTQESLIGKIEKLYLTSNRIIVFDSKAMNILLFNIDGHFIRKIGNRGNGPDEYQFFNDIQFDKINSVIYAQERYQNCIYKYNLDGKLVEKTPKFDIDFNSFYKTKNGYWVYSCFKSNNPNGYNLMLLDNDVKTIKKSFFPQEAFINATFSSTFIESDEGKLFFTYPSSNIIYELKDEQAISHLKIDFGEKTLPYDKIIKIKEMDRYDEVIGDKRFLGDISNVKINNNSIYFSFSETGFNVAGASYNCFYNYLIKKTSIYKNPFINSMDYPVSTQLLLATDKELVYCIDLSVLTDDSFAVLSKQIATDIQFDSNPVLVVCKLKKE
jgi:hypothetical protein